MESSEIKQIRFDLNYTQEELALKMGVTVDTIKSWESGRRKIGGPAKILLQLINDGVQTNGYLER